MQTWSEKISGAIDFRQEYMNIETGTVDTYSGWYYENERGELVNAVDLGEVVPVQLVKGKWEKGPLTQQ